MRKGSLKAYLRLMRPVNCVLMGFAVIVGAALAGSNIPLASWNTIGVALGFVTGFILTAASMTVNDYYDREIDAINEPQRPIPSGAVRPRDALVFAAILSMVGFIGAALTNVTCFLIAVFSWFIFVVYTTVGKRSGLPGNFLVSISVCIPFIYGSVAAVGIIRLPVALFVTVVFLSNTGREITKGIVDVAGDRRNGVKTLAVRFGEKKAALVAGLFYVSAVALSPFPWVFNVVSVWYLPLVTVTDAGLVVSSVMLWRDCSRENARRIKKMVLVWFLFGLFAFIVGTIQ